MRSFRVPGIIISYAAAAWVANRAFESGNFLLWMLGASWMGTVIVAQLMPKRKRRRRRAGRRT